MDLSGFFCVLPQKCSVIFLDIVVCRDRDKQIPPVRPDFILNILSEHSHKMFYTHHFFIRTFCESKDYNYHMPHKTCG